MLKRLICAAASVLLLTASVSALSGKAEISAGSEYEVYSTETPSEKAAETVGMKTDELANYCTENGIVYFAVNSDNTRQIRISVNETPFSQSVVNLSNLSDDKILSLMSDITGNDEIRGDIVAGNGQKFVKTQVSASDSGGGYTVIQYITVAAKRTYVLSFYTESGVDTDYAEELFKTYRSEDFVSLKSEKSIYGYVVLSAVILLCAVSVFIIFTLVRDIAKSDN